MKRILVLAPHTDDGELGAGGTIAKMIDRGDEVYYAAFCHQFDQDLEKEMKLSCKSLNIKESVTYDFQVRMFSEDRQKILNTMINLDRGINPDIVMIPSINDVHQDHGVIAMEALRAFKHKNLISYEMSWNNYKFNPTMYMKISSDNLVSKITAINCYESQKERVYCSKDFITSLALTRGVQINSNYAEAFEVIRWID